MGTFLLGMLLCVSGLLILCKTIQVMGHTKYDGFVVSIVVAFLVIVPIWLGIIMITYDIREVIKSEQTQEQYSAPVVHLSTTGASK